MKKVTQNKTLDQIVKTFEPDLSKEIIYVDCFQRYPGEWLWTQMTSRKPPISSPPPNLKEAGGT